MKAVVCQHAELRIDELPEPVPARGQVRLRVLRCGICGSDLHARTGSDEWAEMAERGGDHRFARSDQAIVYGHEFWGEVAEHGPKTRGTVPTGTPTPSCGLRAGRSAHDKGAADQPPLSGHAAEASSGSVSTGVLTSSARRIERARCRRSPRPSR
jgi:threonine dehydrogenase-like Zn-dependent dehydrogenase